MFYDMVISVLKDATHTHIHIRHTKEKYAQNKKMGNEKQFHMRITYLHYVFGSPWMVAMHSMAAFGAEIPHYSTYIANDGGCQML